MRSFLRWIVSILVLHLSWGEMNEENTDKRNNSLREIREQVACSALDSSPWLQIPEPRDETVVDALTDTLTTHSNEQPTDSSRQIRSPEKEKKEVRSGSACRGDDPPATSVHVRELHEAIQAIRETLAEIPAMLRQELLRVSCENEPDSQACRSNDISIVCNTTRSFTAMANVTSHIVTTQGFTLLLSKSKATWRQAQSDCTKLGMTLVEIEGYKKQHLLERILNEAYPGAEVWTGLIAQDKEFDAENLTWALHEVADGKFDEKTLRFVGSGQQLGNFTNWSIDEPNACKKNVCRCMVFIKEEQRSWFLTVCTNKHYYICQCAHAGTK